MANSIELTSDAELALNQINEMLPNMESLYLVETALKITAALYEKASNGAVIEVKMPDGKVEELRFKVKKPVKKKPAK